MYLLKDLGAFNIFFPSKVWNETEWTELPYTFFFFAIFIYGLLEPEL